MARDLAVSIVHRLIMAPYTSLRHFPPEERDEVEARLMAEVQRILETGGPGAFESPRSAAIAHEVGHAIVSAHDDDRVEKIEIWKTPGGGEFEWAGLSSLKRRPFLMAPTRQ